MINLTNLASSKTLKLDYSGPYLLYNIDFDAIDLKLTTNTYYQQIGENIVARKWGTRTIKVLGYIIADNDMTLSQRKDYMNAMFNLNNDIKLQYDDVYIIGVLTSSIRWGKEEEENNDQFCKFYFELFCPDPLFKSNKLYKTDLSNWQDNLEFPLEIPLDNDDVPTAKYPAGTEFEIMIENATKQFEVGGHIEVPFQIELNIRGDVSNPSFTNIITQEFIKINYDFETDDRVIINTDARNTSPIILIRNNAETNIFKYRDKASKLDMKLYVGTNYVLLDADDGAVFLGGSLSFNQLYTGVSWQC